MPWKVEKRGKLFCVINSNTGRRVPGGCHPTRAAAEAHKRALYANVPEGRVRRKYKPKRFKPRKR